MLGRTISFFPGRMKNATTVVQTLLSKLDAPLTLEPVGTSTDVKSFGEMACSSLTRNRIGLSCSFGLNPSGHPNDRDLRQQLDFYAQVVKVRQNLLPFPDHMVPRKSGFNFVVVREPTEGGIVGHEHEIIPGVTESLKLITKEKTKRCAKIAYKIAGKRDEKKVVAVHKANIMKLSDGLFLQTCTDLHTNYLEVEFESMIVDNCSMQVISNPSQFSVLVAPNEYGQILIGLANGLVADESVLSSYSCTSDFTFFEPAMNQHESNVALLLSLYDLLCYVGMDDQASKLLKGLRAVIKEKKQISYKTMNHDPNLVDQVIKKVSE